MLKRSFGHMKCSVTTRGILRTTCISAGEEMDNKPTNCLLLDACVLNGMVAAQKSRSGESFTTYVYFNFKSLVNQSIFAIPSMYCLVRKVVIFFDAGLIELL